MSSLRPRDWFFATAAWAAALLCIRLGFWQLNRLAQRRARNAEIETRLAQAPIPLPSSIDETADIVYRRVIVRGQFDFAHEIVLVNRARNELPGVHLVTPLLLEGSRQAVMVDRGWIPVEESNPGARAAYAVEGLVETITVVRESQPQPFWPFLQEPTAPPGSPPRVEWRLLNLEAIQSQLPYRLLPIYLEQVETLGQEPLPVPDPDLDLSEGPHLSYAIQWFAFAGTALLGSTLWLRRRLRLARPQEVQRP
ncbi:MAG: SURF1 family protein [Chloroflexota bacterium]